jgi:hypothetical protein
MKKSIQVSSSYQISWAGFFRNIAHYSLIRYFFFLVLELLKAYRTEKKKSEMIKIFEKVLQEYTPCTSISQSETLVEYLQNLTLKNEMQNEELRRVQGEMDIKTKQHTEEVDILNVKVQNLEKEV